MRKTLQMQKLEETHGQDIEALLSERYKRLGTLKAVGVSLDLTESCISRWFTMLDLEISTERTVKAANVETV